MEAIKKVYAYITNADQLLVFRHKDFPEAGIQVPGGTMYVGETPDEAVLRESHEETGLQGLVLRKYLGEEEYQVPGKKPGKTIVRHFFHFLSPPLVPDTWKHHELHPSDGSPAPILFEFYWLPLAEAAGELAPYYAVKLQQLHDSLGEESLPGGLQIDPQPASET